MSCIKSLPEKSPCLYGAILTGVALTAVVLVALGIINLLPKGPLLPALSIGFGGGIGTLSLGSVIMGGTLLLMIQRCRKPKMDPQNPPNVNVPKPHSPLSPDGTGGNTGASGTPAKQETFEIKKGERTD